jgi:diguanylate cyclase (GGDEF)-like protein/PAS domain S-box-containing protein
MKLLPDLHILVIDDNPNIHQDFVKILTTDTSIKKINELENQIFNNSEKNQEKANFPHFMIDAASQGEEGLRRIKQAIAENRPYALAFVDIRMPPGWDGIETIKQIWKIDSNIQIVICTAYSDYTWEETIEQLGMNDNLLILKKPFDNIAVRQLACALTKKWQLIQEAREYTEFLERRVEERTTSLQESVSTLRATLESSADGILVVDNQGKIVDYNNKFIEMWKIPQSVLSAKNNELLFEYASSALDDAKTFNEKLHEIANDQQLVNFDLIRFKDGRVFERYTQPYKLNEQTVGRVWSFRDITQHIFLEEKLAHQATHDELTGLPNRVLLVDRIKQAMLRSKRDRTRVAILFFDLDRFKLINDSFSHQAGDEVLKTVSKNLCAVCREQDTLARIGGDEFVMVLQDLKTVENIVDIADKLLSTINKPFIISHKEITMTTSVGISIYPQDGDKIEVLMRNADLAMYHAKELGANQIQFYTSELNQRSLKRLEQESELRIAILNNEFFLYYQPQFDVVKKKVIAIEALIRWQHPVKGVILPLDFIPLAEEIGLIVPIGEWVIRTACEQNKKFQDMGIPPVRVAVNVTTPQIRQPHFIKMVKRILQETGLRPEYLELELTENIIVNNAKIIHVLSELREIGIQIALDDFGTGNSSLNYLRKIPIDRLKIDRSFIENINTNRNDEVIIRAIITMANSLNLEVIAEGVETQNQLQFLKSQECNEIQGYYLSEPLSVDELKEMLMNKIVAVS